jgi:hypothetical protein
MALLALLPRWKAAGSELDYQCCLFHEQLVDLWRGGSRATADPSTRSAPSGWYSKSTKAESGVLRPPRWTKLLLADWEVRETAGWEAGATPGGASE